jgi:hypothetical protein
VDPAFELVSGKAVAAIDRPVVRCTDAGRTAAVDADVDVSVRIAGSPYGWSKATKGDAHLAYALSYIDFVFPA